MIITVTSNGKLVGSPIDYLRNEDLYWFIKEEVKRGRTVHIAPEGGEERAENV